MSTVRPASLWQRFALWLEDERPGVATGPWFAVNAVLRVEGEFDPDLLVAAAGDLLARHELLRSRLDPDAVVQVVEDAVRPCVEVGGDESPHHPVPSTAPTPLVLRVVRRSAREHVLSAHLHHLFGDPATLWRVLRDLGELYAARLGGPEPAPPTAQYGEYAAHEAELARDPGTARWWREELGGLRFAAPPPDARDAPFALRRPVLPADDTALLETWARRRLSTPFAAVLALLTEELAGHVATGDHVLYNTLFLRRDQPRWRTVAGPCITPAYAAVPLDATADLRALTVHLAAAERHSRCPVWELEPVAGAPSAPFVELIPQLRPDEVPFGPARAFVEAAAGPRDTGQAAGLGIRFRKAVDGALVAHVSGNGRGWTGSAVHAALDGLPDRVGRLPARAG
ncbi:condensation domain-containing protein [Saccharothrix syringae]|uniref:Condensation domain-containing protein n=1 Tax=Saccharothrix syringae TaxID=103733 RepID=A0A5Q0GVC6_SACSY|nr:hypothetical protein [Saccharothrix syringae]QFZ17871.1 hypothetical protein EKG83_10595 [Saccharothrix syringae]